MAVLLCLLLLQLASHALTQTNDQPIFDDGEITVIVSEDHNTSLPVLANNFQAFDEEGDPITYSIPEGGLGSDNFFLVNYAVDSFNVFFKSDVTVDREKVDEYIVLVQADDGMDHGEADPVKLRIIIEIGDINDETPVITNLPNSVEFAENTNLNTILYDVDATDEDIGKNGQIRYSIISVVPSSGQDKFEIYVSSGEVFLSKSLDYEDATEYTITIRAEDRGDQPLSSVEELTLIVMDFNDQDPKFDQNQYSTQIYENLTEGSFVLQVLAEDQDIAIDDDIIYSINNISPPSGGSLFVVDNTTGSIFVDGELDVDGPGFPKNYTITILAEEFMDATKFATTTAFIVILDVNDNPPKFEEDLYNSTLSESSDFGTTVVTVTATDEDEGINAHFTFHLVNLLSTPFPFNITHSLDGESGHVQLVDELDFETTSKYMFQVIATEVVDNRNKTASTVVTVSVTNINDNFPIFDKLEYFADISENANIGDFVGKVTAQDGDEGSFGFVYYYLINNLDVFEINDKNGMIVLKQKIDYETVQSFALTVAANDSAMPPSAQLKAQVQVHVQVLDANDNGPMISVNGSQAITEVNRQLEEEQEVGVLVFVVEAEDVDDPPNDELEYFIEVLEPKGFTGTHFAYSDTAKNQLVTSVSLDYESVQQYKLRACVTDFGSLLNTGSGSGSGLANTNYDTVNDLPQDHVDCIDLIIDVIDENDNNPVFVGGVDSYEYSVDEEQPKNTFVGYANATDRDSGLFGTVRYSLSGVDHENFTIDSVTGDITTTGPIDRERKEIFDLIVTAKDLDVNVPLSAIASLTITILDLNDNVPQFSQPIYVENDIVENTISISIQVMASDADIDENDDLTYAIVGGNTDDQFVIDSNSGEITRNSLVTLDREENPEFELIVSVTDGGSPPLSSNGTVFIELQDDNDNSPLFEETTYELNVTEGTLIGTQVLTVVANDIDSGPNGVVRYSILMSGQDYQDFSIGQMSGIISTNKDFDFDTEKAAYYIEVEALDSGVPPKSSQASVTVTILDINDNSPIFSKVQYSKSISEAASGGSSITTIKASDSDSGDNKKITYSITNITVIGTAIPTDDEADDTVDLFTIDNNNGEVFLSVGRSFDYESVTGYNLLVEAGDGGVPSKTDSSIVQVTIIDFNDNSPVLSDESYSIVLMEDTEVPTTFNIFSYDDEDSGNNAIATYTIDNTNEFIINPVTGVLTLVSGVDYETEDYFEFKVTVTDSGNPPLSDTATVNVTIIDNNDNSPIFQMPSSPFIVNIDLNESDYTHSVNVLYTFVATDDDDEMNGDIEYTITSGDTSLFSINVDNGEFEVIGNIDRESQDYYELTIAATDKGLMSRSATATVNINVLDVNEDPPSFVDNSYSNTISENNGVGRSLTQVEAEDPDLGINAYIVYSVNDTVNFNVSSDGVISANKIFDYEMVKTISALVTATDGGGLLTRVTFTLTITDENDNEPEFINSFNTPFQLPEDTSVSFFLASAEAKDIDSGANGDVTYQMSGAEGKFSIDSNGQITLQSLLDRETNDHYSLVVTANDHGSPQMSSMNVINVTVTDINDQQPTFEATFYNIEVPEDESLSTTLISVNATDNDIGQNAELTFDIVSGNTGNAFVINQVYDSANDKYTGHIVLDMALDYETETSYSLEITATDMGAVARTGTAYVSIKIVNINDEVPVFSPSNSYSFSISEIAIFGTPVGTVYATDDDAGTFGKITSYSFPSGTSSNVTNNFDLLSSNGVITLSNTSNLDYDNGNKSYTFSIAATDGGGESSTASIVVNVLGHNEDSPSFKQQSYVANVPENLPMGQLLTMVVAIDPDNSPVTYEIIEGNDDDNFEIDTLGNIRTKKELDRETKEVYVLRIQASDSGINPLTGFTQVEVTVLDENDNFPLFPSTNVEYQVSETAQKDLILTPVVAASDKDKDNNSKITYTAQGEGVPDVFSVDSASGEIKLNGTLNYENKSKYNFLIIAEDGGSVPKKNNLNVTIVVLDFNDNAPEFDSNLYTETISESIGKGSYVTTVFANDSDSGSNAEISYSIEGSNRFEINSVGEILTKEELDYEIDTMYSLTVTATDNGTPVRSATSIVELTILDANDNTPLFGQSSYSYEIAEQDVASDLLLLSVAATDNDGSQANSNVTYSITSGNDEMKFIIDEDGNLYATKDLDYEDKNAYLLTVEAKDNPIDPQETRYNVTQVNIILQDINDNSPIWKENQYRVTPNQFAGTIREDAMADTLVLFVEATDEDSDVFGKVTYSFATPSDKFYIDDTTGFVYTHGNLDVEVVDFYNLTIVARDGGLISTMGYLSIEVIDVNDRQPSFISSFFYKEVSEAEDEGFLLVTLAAFDIDSDDLDYSIISGNDNGFFLINISSGEVSLAKKLDRETVDDFLLTVFVTDGEFNDTTNLRVVVNDVNDNAPQFIDAPYFAYIEENTVSGAVLLYNMNDNTTRVQAIDADKPDTSNSIVVYEMVGVNKDVLNIGPSTGVLTVASGANLDYEGGSQTVVVNVLAQDSATPPGALSSLTTITINIIDVNDNSPVFGKGSYSASVMENEPAGTTVLKAIDIEAEDVDTGVGGIVTYSIVNSDPSVNLADFVIDNSTGEVMLAASLDREETHEIVLTIRATDGGPSTFMTAKVSLTVTVLDMNDNTPVFNQSSYIKSIPEDIGGNMFVTMVLAEDDDDNNNGNVEYSLINYMNLFQINKDNGVLSTVTDLDYETQNLYSILVEACDKGTPDILCSNVTVTVQITDVNDLFPTFDYNIYYTTICDDATPVTDVLQVIALDGDSGDYGKVSYSLANGSSLGSLFTLNEDNGQIKLIENIPKNNTGSTLIVSIIGTDGGSPAKTGMTEVQILFCDRNSTPIYFNQSLYYGAVLENESPPISVTTVTAISSNTPIIYSILPPVGDNHFNITSNGEIIAIMMLDREERETYTLIVKAVDSAASPNTAYSTILVAILDVNDNPPMFIATPYAFSLTEELIGTTIINTVVATDPDQPFDPKGIIYSIDSASNPDGVFEIDTDGTISAIKPVDRETNPVYQLKIKATDTDPSDPRITTATVTITILDINDNGPVFDMLAYSKSVSENHPPNFSILTVTATDADADLNKEITYSIESGGNDKFFIDSTTGVIKTLSQLDYEDTSFYNISIKAQDKGASPQSSFTYVMVNVEDYNDCTPMFTKGLYNATLKEDFGFDEFLDINATDCDSGMNKEIMFAIVAGNNDNRFQLNATTGQLSLKNSLDFEKEASYILHISVTDGGSPSLSNLTQVIVGVADVNDEDPMFQQSDYEVSSLPEDRNVGFEIIVVTATDADASADNSALEYSIKSGNTNGDFKIDPDSGSVKIDKPLDRENTSSYSIVIEVKDKGIPPRSATVTLDITITDVNDNPPIITNLPSGSTLDVFENATNTQVLFTVTASDLDINENSLLQFSLQNYDNVFSINPSTGEIMLQTMLDYDESDREYQLSIEVTDLAVDFSSRQTDHATLNILVEDINDNKPMFVQKQYMVSRPEEEIEGQIFATVEATDNDGTLANSNVTYSISVCSPNCLNRFSIDPSTGVITNEDQLDREVNDVYFLTVIGVNAGAYPESSDWTNVTITVTDINDFPPKFIQNVYSTNIFEGVTANTLLLVVKATDGDQPNTINTELSYKIVSVIANNPFSLNEDSGTLEVTGSIDRESVAFYNFTVRVEDNGDTKLWDDVQIEITVDDRNDRPPMFVSGTQSVRVNEGLTNSNLPYSLWTPSYTDGDEPTDNKESLYSIINVTNGSNSLGVGSSLVSINQSSGEVSLISLVDFEVTKLLTVLISVYNSKTGTGDLCGGFDKNCSLSDTATLNIEITDFNDNVPVFDTNSYSGQISTSADPGTQIRQVYAEDEDTQNNFGQVSYRLSEGSSTKFRIQEETGWVVSRGTFENDNGRTFTIEIEAFDNLGQDPSRVSSIQMSILALSDFRRVLIIFDREVSVFTEAKEQLIVDTLHDLTGYTIVVEEIREHVLDDVGDVDPTKTDFIFHAINSNGEIVDFDILIENLDVGAFFNAIADCQPMKITSLRPDDSYPKVQTTLIYLIVLCAIIAIGSIIVLVLACQQRYIALNSMWKSQMRDAFYGAADPTLIEGAMSRDFSGETFEMRGRSTKSPLYVEPYENFGPLDTSAIGSSVGDVDSIQQGNPLYEEREIRMDMFELSDDETDGDLDDENLLAEALKDDDSDSGSVTAI